MRIRAMKLTRNFFKELSDFTPFQQETDAHREINTFLVKLLFYIFPHKII
jgi:hypothetical protein